MKIGRLIVIATAALLTGLLIQAKAIDNVTPPAGGGFYEGSVYIPMVDTDTNTTDTTAYTPRFKGQILLGKTDGSNAVWLARGLTTNDWGLVTSSGGPFTAQDLAADSVGASELIESEGYTVGSMTTTGAVTISEGKVTDSTIVSADIKDGEIVNADINASAAIAVTKLGTGGVIPANSATSLTNLPAAQLTGNAPAAAITNAFAATLCPAYAAGVFNVVNSTQLVFIASGVTNVVDADITH